MKSLTPNAKNPGGAPPKNLNAMTHGARRVLEGDKLPPGCAYLRRSVNGFRQALEAETLAKHGGVSMTQAAAINAAVRAETRARLLSRWLRQAASADEVGAIPGAIDGPAETTTEATIAETRASDGKTTTIAKWLRKGLPIETRIKLLADIAAATESRDRAIGRLRLDEEATATVAATLYAPRLDDGGAGDAP